MRNKLQLCISRLCKLGAGSAIRPVGPSYEEVLNHLHKKFRGLMLEPIPLNTDIPEVYQSKLPVHRYNASAPATKDYAAVAKEVMNRVQKE